LRGIVVVLVLEENAQWKVRASCRTRLAGCQPAEIGWKPIFLLL
jgi:hypothetical protein